MQICFLFVFKICNRYPHMLACSITVFETHILLNRDDFIPAFTWRLPSNYQFNSSSGHLKKKSCMLSVKPQSPGGFTSVVTLHEIMMGHVTQHMPTDYPFKGSMTESSRQTQCKTMGTLREGGLRNDLFKHMWVHLFALMVTRILFVSWKFRQSLPSAVPQSEQGGKANSVL